jgi:uncharacterized membrane protein YphA (DoxX/SURF4 family)
VATALALVALRVAIGWMFLAGGWEKHNNKKFTSEPFLRAAKGPLAPLYQSKLSDVHGFRKHIEQPAEQRPAPEGKPDAKGGEATEAEHPYKAWQDEIVQDWGRDRQKISDHFGFDKSQNEQADQLSRFYEGSLKDYLEKHSTDLAGFRHDLWRMQGKKPEPEIPTDPNMQQRRDTALTIRQRVADQGNKYRTELAGLAKPEQEEGSGEMAVASSPIQSFDRFIIYSHIAIGFCLVAGLLTRLAAAGAVVFLLSVVASQPFWIANATPWVSGPNAVMYQVILMFACLVLMTSGAGRWAGVDYLLFGGWKKETS